MAVRYVTVTPTVLNADAYDANDVVFDTTEIPFAGGPGGSPSVLDSVIMLDKDDNAAANFTLWFLDSNVTFGTKDAAPSITDADAASIIGYTTIASATFLDVGGSKLGQAHNLGILVKPVAGSLSIYVAGQSAGTPTQTTGGIVLRFGFRDV